MHVVIVGCGRVGSSLARQLLSAGHTVAVIDKRAASFERFLADWPGQKIVGYGFDRDRLQEAGIERADALAAVTSGDNSNIMVARIAKETYQVGRVMARIYDPRRAGVYERLGIPTVATVEWTTDQAMRRLLPDQNRADWVDATGGVALVERRLPDAWVGRKLGELEESRRWRVVALTRAGKAGLADLSLLIQENDVVTLAVAGDAMDALEQHIAASAGKDHH
ncbi:MAG: transport system, NAD-binding component [Acidimicrobiales bacterium]|nr:transport system, NAD-binding component [Acidimicrobiales bacterium]